MLLRGEADEAHLEAGGRSAGCASREKAIRGASSAWADVRDVRGRESRAFELVADDGAQVDNGFAGAAPCPRVILGAFNLTSEAIAELGVNFETTLADRRAHRGANVGGASTKSGHRPDASIADVCDDSAPSCMQCAGYFAFRVDHQYRHAVGREYSQHDPGLSGHDPVTRRTKRGGVASRGVNDVAMHLVEAGDELESRHLVTQAFPVGIDGALIVTYPVGKIHRGERAGADAAGAADESVADRGVGPGAQYFHIGGVGW
jgi:hypothetical protein